MKDILLLLALLLTTVAKLLGPGGTRTIVAENLLLKHQLLTSNRSRRKAPNLLTLDRWLLGFWSLFLNPGRILSAAVIINPSTLLKFHAARKSRKYRMLYSLHSKRKPGPKGPTKELIQATVDLMRSNPRIGCPNIAQRISNVFEVDIDKEVVIRALSRHYRPDSSDIGHSLSSSESV